jgi:hypothetical protein
MIVGDPKETNAVTDVWFPLFPKVIKFLSCHLPGDKKKVTGWRLHFLQFSFLLPFGKVYAYHNRCHFHIQTQLQISENN